MPGARRCFRPVPCQGTGAMAGRGPGPSEAGEGQAGCVARGGYARARRALWTWVASQSSTRAGFTGVGRDRAS